MGKKKQPKQRSAKQLSDGQLIQAAERATAHAKWKDALNAYKELNKRHPGHYQAQLIQVQIQRYQAFLDRELFESADQLLSSLRDQLPAEQLKAFELQRAVSLKDQDAIQSLSWLSLEQQVQSDQALDGTLMESLIFSEAQPPATIAEHPEVETLLAVRSGFIALCQGQADVFTAATAKIGRKSQLAHWKLLLRAVNAWYSHDDPTLEKCLEKLTRPSESHAQANAGSQPHSSKAPRAAANQTPAAAVLESQIDRPIPSHVMHSPLADTFALAPLATHQ